MGFEQQMGWEVANPGCLWECESRHVAVRCDATHLLGLGCCRFYLTPPPPCLVTGPHPASTISVLRDCSPLPGASWGLGEDVPSLPAQYSLLPQVPTGLSLTLATSQHPL